MNGFKRTHREIVYIVKICEATLRQRLNEFTSTSSGRLTVEQFQNIWLEEAEDPPCFTNDKTGKRKADDIENTDETEEEIHEQMQNALNATNLRSVLEGLKGQDADLATLDADLEVSSALCSKEEIEFKTMLWTDMNSDWLKTQHGIYSCLY